jgi:hypothetical protein
MPPEATVNIAFFQKPADARERGFMIIEEGIVKGHQPITRRGGTVTRFGYRAAH